MKKSLRDVSRFSATAAYRYRLTCLAIVFIVIVILAVGSALILAFDESAPLPIYGFDFSLDDGAPGFLHPFSRAGTCPFGNRSWVAPCSIPCI